MNKTLRISMRVGILFVCILFVFATLCAALLIFLVQNERHAQPLLPDQAYLDADPNLQPYPNISADTDLQHPEGGSAASFICESLATVSLSKESVSLMFANPTESLQNIVIELIIQDRIIAQSGRIEPGYCVTSLRLYNRDLLVQGIYQGSVIIYFHDLGTGEQTISSSVPVTVTVKD